MTVPVTTYEVIYNSKNITKDILPFIISLTYSDKSEGESDELEIVVEDAAGLWANEWYPLKGDSITARIIQDGKILQCGTFILDELTGTGGNDGNTVSIKGLGAGINNKVRTKRSYAHENKTLREIANTVAAAHGFTVTGEIANVSIQRVTQYRQNDLRFLKRIAHEYGYVFSIRDKQLVFSSIFSVENKAAALVIDATMMISWSITDKTADTYAKAKVSYHHPKHKKVISYQHIESSPAYSTVKNDSLDVHIRAENKQQADIKSKVLLYRKNSLQQSGSVELQGNLIALAGNNCDIQGIGMFSGLYYISESTHTVTRDGGYVTSLTVKRIAVLLKEKQKKTQSD